MRRRKVLVGAIVLSAIAHVSILFVFALIQWGLIDPEPVLIETVFSEERQQEEFSQELDINTEVSENLNPVAGGAVTGAIGASSGPPISTARIEMSDSLKEPELVANIREVALPGEALLGEDLGESAVTGETGAVVEGYGAAMSRLTREILRMMRESKVMVVWMFDESESMKDDQQKIAEQFHKVYEELGIAVKKEEEKKPGIKKSDRFQDEVLLTSITSYGDKLNILLDKPSSDVETIKEAIGKISIDQTGKEHMCAAVQGVISKYGAMAARQDRKLVIVMVSDESGDDGSAIEEAIQSAKRANAPVYILGREAVFGYPYASQKWVDPEFNLDFWIRINRGPETPFPEALQWDGFAARDDAYQSGFGPYEQVRLVKETGGIYFMLPGDEEMLSGRGAHDRRKFDFLAMKEYEPKLESRREYEAERAKHPFRMAIWNVIVELNPHLDKELSIRRYHYQPNPQELLKESQENFRKGLYALDKAARAVVALEKAKKGRDSEESWRWRAAYDLLQAQVLAYRVRIFQYLLALDQHVKKPPAFVDPKNNEWHLSYVKELLPPDPVQVKLTKVDLKVLEEQQQKATELYNYVIQEHPGTPWARRAQEELNYGFGIRFKESYYDPRHYDPAIRDQIKVPNL